MERLELKVQGMSCGHCVAAVREALEAEPGVAEVAVEIGRARVGFDPALTSAARLAEAVTAAGYTTSVEAGR